MQEDRADPTPDAPLGLFEACGIELEYMIVDAETLDVSAAADSLLEAAAGRLTEEYVNGEIVWDNELALHVIELKCNGPRPNLEGLSGLFCDNVALANDKLAPDGRRLMPSAMHPWMDPERELRLWPHGSRERYEAFDRIFSCRGHGWANLQSMHVNLPFSNDDEFARLHSAIRFLLPILPGLAASSPVIDGKPNGTLDNRLAVYRDNCARIPSITGEVVPDVFGSAGEYRELLLERLYRDLEPHDAEGALRYEWVNARGAIARFDRMAIEIRVLDVQEAPPVDLAYAAVIIEVLKLLCEERWGDMESLESWPTSSLAGLLGSAVQHAENAEIGERRYLQALGFARGTAKLSRLWEHLIEAATVHGGIDDADGRILEHYLRHGSLAARISRAVGAHPTRADLAKVYGQLCGALASGTPFSA